VTIGMDEFAQKLVGAVSAVRLPAIGAPVEQGASAIGLASGSKSVDLLSPVDGTVVDVNDRVAAAPAILADDPYGAGWLVKVRSPRVAANLKQLLAGPLAQRFMEESCAALGGLTTPALGTVCQDGGAPIDGMARSLDPEHWDELARRFLRTEITPGDAHDAAPDSAGPEGPARSAHGR
jgi:glycine cleavage system H lipoate-binding protein